MKLRTNPINNYISKNYKMYLLLGIMFIVGLCIGSIIAVNIQQEQGESARQSMGLAIKGLNKGVESGNIFFTSFSSVVKPVLLIWLAGLNGYGVWIIMLIIMAKGAITGFSAGLIIRLYDIKGVALSAASILPQHLIIIPLILFIGCSGFEQSYISKTGVLSQHNRSALIRYMFLLFVAIIISVFAAAVDSYVTSNILKTLSYLTEN